MKKEDQRQSYNKVYWQENEEMLRGRSYQQAFRQDKMTTRDEMKEELYELTEKHRNDEQTKIEMERGIKEEKERVEREEYEKWKQEKGNNVTDTKTEQ